MSGSLEAYHMSLKTFNGLYLRRKQLPITQLNLHCGSMLLRWVPHWLNLVVLRSKNLDYEKAFIPTVPRFYARVGCDFVCQHKYSRQDRWELELLYVLMWHFNEMLELPWTVSNLNTGGWKEGDLVLESRALSKGCFGSHMLSKGSQATELALDTDRSQTELWISQSPVGLPE